MNARSALLILLAVAGVILVFLLTRSFLNQTQQNAQPVRQAETSSTSVLVAKRFLPVGTLLRAEDTEFKSWPKKGVGDGFITQKSEAQKLLGQVVRYEFTVGEPISTTALVAPGTRGFLAAALTPGMRAATIRISPTSGVGGFIFPGDRVDVILTHLLAEGVSEQARQVAETIFENVRVLGLDQRSTVDEPVARVSKTATLEVTPKMAEKIALLPNLGTLNLSLRSLGTDTEDTNPEGTSVSSVSSVSSGTPASSDAAPENTVENTIENTAQTTRAPQMPAKASYSLGGHVSQFIPTPETKTAKGMVRVARGSSASILNLNAKNPLTSDSTAADPTPAARQSRTPVRTISDDDAPQETEKKDPDNAGTEQ